MDTETRREIERLRDEALLRCAQVQEVSEHILTITAVLLGKDAPPRPVPHRKSHPHLRLVRGLLIGGAAALAGRLLSDHKAAAVASLTATALAAPLVAVPLILSIPSPSAAPRPVHHVRRRDPAPVPAPLPAATRAPAADPARIPAPSRRHAAVPAPSSSPSPASSPLPPLSLLTPPFPPRECILRLHGICLRLRLGAH